MTAPERLAKVAEDDAAEVWVEEPDFVASRAPSSERRLIAMTPERLAEREATAEARGAARVREAVEAAADREHECYLCGEQEDA